MPARIDVIFDPDPSVFAHAFWEVSDALRDPRIPLLFAAQQTREEIVESFQTQTSPDGESWTDWSDDYKDVAEGYPNIGMLRRDDDLYRAATDKDSFVINGDTLFYDTSDWPVAKSGDSYGWAHQEGAPDRKTKGGAPNPLPQRQFVGVSAAGEAAIMGAFTGWFDNSIALYETRFGGVGLRGRNKLGQFETTPMLFTAGSRG